MIRRLVLLTLGAAAGAAWEHNRPFGTRWANRELVKYVTHAGRWA
jgi:hypothetical protein